MPKTNRIAARPKRRLMAEYAIEVFTDGSVSWAGFDRYLWRKIHQKPLRLMKSKSRTPRSC